MSAAISSIYPPQVWLFPEGYDAYVIMESEPSCLKIERLRERYLTQSEYCKELPSLIANKKIIIVCRKSGSAPEDAEIFLPNEFSDEPQIKLVYGSDSFFVKGKFIGPSKKDVSAVYKNAKNDLYQSQLLLKSCTIL